MSNASSFSIGAPTSSHQQAQLSYLNRAIEEARKLLPAQGPLSAFAFLNTLEALENLPFDEGVRRGARLFGCQPYLAEDIYREKLGYGRIRLEDLSEVLRADLGVRGAGRICSLGTRFELRMAMLEHPLRSGPPDELRWFVAETDALSRFRPEVSPEVRDRFIRDTHHWVMRELSTSGAQPPESAEDQEVRELVLRLLNRDTDGTIESWNDRTWAAVSLQMLWRVCRGGARKVQDIAAPTSVVVRHRDVLKDAISEDSDVLVHDVLVRFCAAFTDQGFAQRRLPDRDEGFFKAFCAYYRQPRRFGGRWLRGLSKELARLEAAGTSPLESVLESLNLLGVNDDDWDDFIPATLLALRGWSGILSQMEVRSDRVALGAPAGSLVEFLAVRLILERMALAHLARKRLKYDGPLSELRDAIRENFPRQTGASVEQRAFQLFQLAQVLGWSPPALHSLSRKEWAALIAEIEQFSSVERRRIFHEAYERRYRDQALDALSVHALREPKRVPSPRFQTVFCIDAREESFRRHLEEVAPDSESFGTAGFFNVPIYYRGASDAHFTAGCPVVVRPKHWVVEDVVYPMEGAHRRRAKTRRALGMASHEVHMRSRSIAGGALLSGGFGVLASVPLVARVMFPRLTAQLRRMIGRLMDTPTVTRLSLERAAPTCGPDGDELGFSLEEMAGIGARVLGDIGLTSGFARLVMFLGHGSACLNNPHKSAYDCGACSGSAGGPNARALAAMLNDFRVREMLAKRGFEIPGDTYFLGGQHNTCSDSITFFDLDLLPKSHMKDFAAARESLDETCLHNAHERCRRFDSAPLNQTLAEAKRHVEGRSEDLAQTRPEFGNATNAMCFVGRRARSRGLFLDRRAFMQSYDPTQDDDQASILARILAPVVPVCSGINLQYFFSYIDSAGYGSGNKLPHNVTSLLGVMDGAASDLRSGLPWQGVEIHEPMRLLFVIETTPEAILGIMERDPVVGRILRNGWVQLALLDPEANAIRVYRNGGFQLYDPSVDEVPKVEKSLDWYGGWRDHLAFAVVEPVTSNSAEPLQGLAEAATC